MNSNISEHFVEIQSQSGQKSSGIIKIRQLGLKERMTTGFKKLGFFWLIALGVLFIPILHFILVPLFFFLGLFFCIRICMQLELVDQGNGKCPACSNEIVFGSARPVWPLNEICPKCAEELTLNLK